MADLRGRLLLVNYALPVTITVVRPTWVEDAYGDLQPTGPPTFTDIEGCAVAPRSSSDVTEPARQGVLIGLTVYAPIGSDIQPTDRIDYDGNSFEIDGDIGKWRSPFSPIVDGIEFALRRAIG
jgi:hypothetical protein